MIPDVGVIETEQKRYPNKKTLVASAPTTQILFSEHLIRLTLFSIASDTCSRMPRNKKYYIFTFLKID